MITLTLLRSPEQHLHNGDTFQMLLLTLLSCNLATRAKNQGGLWESRQGNWANFNGVGTSAPTSCNSVMYNTVQSCLPTIAKTECRDHFSQCICAAWFAVAFNGKLPISHLLPMIMTTDSHTHTRVPIPIPIPDRHNEITLKMPVKGEGKGTRKRNEQWALVSQDLLNVSSCRISERTQSGNQF